MWSQTYRKVVSGIDIETIWNVWADVNQWHTWHGDIDYAKIEGEFKTGNFFILKPKGMKELKIHLIKVEKNRHFTDLTKFPLAKLYGIHDFIIKGEELEIKTTMKVEGPLAFIWRKLVAEKIANGEEEQTRALLERVKEVSQ